jgi:hypothetical protein
VNTRTRLRRFGRGCMSRCRRSGSGSDACSTGFSQYHAVPGNWASLFRFRERIGNYWAHALKRRSQKNRERLARAAWSSPRNCALKGMGFDEIVCVHTRINVDT